MEMNLAHLSAGLGAGISVIGAGMGIGRLAAAALESAGRQPEAAGSAQTLMLISAALIEGVALFSCVICMLLAVK
jgi:F-type H+-transporting ATPase subunit c